MKKIQLLFVGLFIGWTMDGQITYVNLIAEGKNDGSSWEDAYTDLNEAFEKTKSGAIWIAEGKYFPTDGTDRTIAFVVSSNVSILGGFPKKDEPRLGDRDWKKYETIISGEIGSSDEEDNSFSLLIMDFDEPANNLIDGVFFEDANSAVTESEGGAINIRGNRNPESKVIFNNCEFYNNRGNSSGGAIDCDDVMLEIKNCLFEYNTADYDGGAIAVNSRIANGYLLNLENCIFQGNYAEHGGALSVSGTFNPKVKAIIRGCQFEDNTSIVGGGAIESTWLSLEVYNSKFSSNFTSSKGGAINFFSDHESTQDAQLWVVNCEFEFNKSNHIGGAIGGKGIHRIVSSLFIENNATNGGGAIYHSEEDSLMVTNCTFVRNVSSGDGEVISNSEGDSTFTFITNSVFFENELFLNNMFDFSRPKNYAEIHYSFINKSTCPEDIICGDGMIFNENSPFEDYQTDRFVPKENSPLINAGKNDHLFLFPFPETDMTYQPRIVGGTVDIGAYEVSVL